MARWLSQRGARVRVADTPRAAALRRAARARVAATCRLATGAFRAESFRERRPDRHQPGRAGTRAAGRRRRRKRGVPVVGDIELFAQALPTIRERQGAGDHRLQRQEHGDRDDRRDVPRGGTAAPSWPATSACRCSTRCSRSRRAAARTRARCVRARAVELPARDHPSASTRTRPRAEPERGPPRSLRRHGGLRRGQGAHLPRQRRAGAQSPGRVVRAAWRWPGRTVFTFGLDEPARRARLGPDATCEGETWLAQGEQKLMPVSQLRVAGLHNAANALAALALAARDRPALRSRCCRR